MSTILLKENMAKNVVRWFATVLGPSVPVNNESKWSRSPAYGCKEVQTEEKKYLGGCESPSRVSGEFEEQDV